MTEYIIKMNTISLTEELETYANNLPARYSVTAEGDSDSESTNYDISVIGTKKGANCYVFGNSIMADFWAWEHGELVELRSNEYKSIAQLKRGLARIR